MRKSLAIIASALLLAVAATATHDRLRYDSTVFADSQVTGGGSSRSQSAEYPPCIRGVREDRCIQLYERGVRRSYQRWAAARGRAQQVADAAPGARSYRPCRSRSDDRCQQRARTTRTAGAARPARTIRSQQAQRRAAVARPQALARLAPARIAPARAAPVRAAQAQAPSAQARTSTAVARQRASIAPPPRQTRPAPGSGAPRRPGGTPGI